MQISRQFRLCYLVDAEKLKSGKAVAALRLAGRTRIFCPEPPLQTLQESSPTSLNPTSLNWFSSINWVSAFSSPLLFPSQTLATMAGGGGKYRHLGRKSSHRQALLRNLVTSLFENESITTTWAKAKEAQRLADKLITLGKKNSEASRRRALEIFYVRDPPSFLESLLSRNNALIHAIETPRNPSQTLRSSS